MHRKISVSIAAAMLASTVMLAALSASQAIGVVDTIPLSGFPYGIVYDSAKGEVYVNCPYTTDQTVAISDSINQVVNTTDESGTILYMACDSAKGEIFQSVWQVQSYSPSSEVNSSAIYILSDATDSVIKTIPIGSYPGPIAYDSQKGELFAASGEYQTPPNSLLPQGPGTSNYYIAVISDSSNSVVAEIPLAFSPSDLVYDSGKGEIFATNGDTVTVISDSNNSATATITVGADAQALAYDSGKEEIFVANSGGNTVSVISDSTNTVVANVTVGYYPSCIAYDSGKGELYVTNPNTAYGEGSLSVISDSNDTVVATIPNVGSYAAGIAYDSAKSELFIANCLNNLTGGTSIHSISVISDSPTLTAPSISASSELISQGQTSKLTSSITTGTPPYTYQWLIQPPNGTALTPVDNATSPDYDFATSSSIATGNWTFLLQVTDATGTTVNSTAVTVTLNPHSQPMSSILNPSFQTTTYIAIAVSAVIVALAALLFMGKKRGKTAEAKLINACRSRVRSVNCAYTIFCVLCCYLPAPQIKKHGDL